MLQSVQLLVAQNVEQMSDMLDMARETGWMSSTTTSMKTIKLFVAIQLYIYNASILLPQTLHNPHCSNCVPYLPQFAFELLNVLLNCLQVVVVSLS